MDPILAFAKNPGALGVVCNNKLDYTNVSEATVCQHKLLKFRLVNVIFLDWPGF